MVAMVTSVTVVLSDSFGTRIVPTLWKGVTTLLLPELFHREDEAEPEPSSVSAVAEELTDQASATLSAEPARVSYQVDGVHCEGCVERINDGLSSLSGVMTVQADTAGRVHLEGTTSPATVSEGLDGLGFPVRQVIGPGAGPASADRADTGSNGNEG